MTNVAMIWNFWPVSMFFWTPIRFGLNILIFPIYFLTGWIAIAWNFIFETIFYTINIFVDLYSAGLMAAGVMLAVFGGLYVTFFAGLFILANILLYPMIYTIPS